MAGQTPKYCYTLHLKKIVALLQFNVNDLLLLLGNTQPYLDRLSDQQHPIPCRVPDPIQTALQPALFGYGFIVVTTNQSLNNVDRRPVLGLPGQELGLFKHVHCNPKQGGVVKPTNVTTRMIVDKILSSLICHSTCFLIGKHTNLMGEQYIREHCLIKKNFRHSALLEIVLYIRFRYSTPLMEC